MQQNNYTKDKNIQNYAKSGKRKIFLCDVVGGELIHGFYFRGLSRVAKKKSIMASQETSNPQRAEYLYCAKHSVQRKAS